MVPCRLHYAAYTTLLEAIFSDLLSIESEYICRHPVRREIFLEEFWKCFNRLEDTADEMIGKAAYFRFLTLLGAASVCSAQITCEPPLHAVLFSSPGGGP